MGVVRAPVQCVLHVSVCHVSCQREVSCVRMQVRGVSVMGVHACSGIYSSMRSESLYARYLVIPFCTPLGNHPAQEVV